MNKKRTIQRRGLSAVLALSVCFGLLPPTAGAAVTAEHDWEIFDASDTYNLPGTQEQILQEMIRNPEFAEKALQTMFCQKRTIMTTMNTAIMSRIPL